MTTEELEKLKALAETVLSSIGPVGSSTVQFVRALSAYQKEALPEVALALIAEIERLRSEESRLTWAMRVMFAWAKKHEQASIPMPVFHRYLSKVDGTALPRWRVAVPFADSDDVYRGIRIESFSTPEAATFAAAVALAKEDPELDR